MVLPYEAGQAAVHKGAENDTGLQTVLHILRVVEEAVAVQDRLEEAHVQGPHVGPDRQGVPPEVGRLVAAAAFLQVQRLRHGLGEGASHDIPRIGLRDCLQQAQSLIGGLRRHHGDAVHFQHHTPAAPGSHMGPAQTQGLGHTDVQHRIPAQVGKGLFFLCHGFSVTPSPAPAFPPGPQPGGRRWETRSCQ